MDYQQRLVATQLRLLRQAIREGIEKYENNLKCRLCGCLISEKEVVENAATCNYCALQNKED